MTDPAYCAQLVAERDEARAEVVSCGERLAKRRQEVYELQDQLRSATQPRVITEELVERVAKVAFETPPCSVSWSDSDMNRDEWRDCARAVLRFLGYTEQDSETTVAGSAGSAAGNQAGATPSGADSSPPAQPATGSGLSPEHRDWLAAEERSRAFRAEAMARESAQAARGEETLRLLRRMVELLEMPYQDKSPSSADSDARSARAASGEPAVTPGCVELVPAETSTAKVGAIPASGALYETAERLEPGVEYEVVETDFDVNAKRLKLGHRFVATGHEGSRGLGWYFVSYNCGVQRVRRVTPKAPEQRSGESSILPGGPGPYDRQIAELTRRVEVLEKGGAK